MTANFDELIHAWDLLEFEIRFNSIRTTQMYHMFFIDFAIRHKILKHNNNSIMSWVLIPFINQIIVPNL